MRRRAALAVAGLALLACASTPESELEASWKADWNRRADSATTRWQNPCGDPEFMPWALAFIADCEPEERIAHEECARRQRWLEQRVDQCRVWRDYLLRNHGKRVRDDGAVEPPVRVD